jgi:DNA-binding CsgD family transcriptional regulator
MLAEHFANADTNPLLAAMPRLVPGSPVARASVYSDLFYFRSALWNEVFRPQRLAHRAVACVLRSDEYLVPLGVLRGTNEEDFSAREFRLLQAVLPHLQRGMQISLRMAALESDAALSIAAFDRLPVSLILADDRCRVLHLNRTGEEIIAAGDGLHIRNGVLAARSHSDDVVLRYAVARVTGQPGNGSKTLLIKRSEGRRPYVLLVAPVDPNALSFAGQSRRRSLILINDPERHSVRLPRRLVDLFHLSPTEAQLATTLLSGGRLEELAEERGISINTIKTQMKSIFAKTGTRQRSELIHLLDSVSEIG